MASMADAVHHPLDIWVLSMVGPWVMAMNESLRSGDLGDEEEEEYDERVHGDRPAMNTTEDKKPKGREGRRQSGWEEKAGAPFALYGRPSMKQKYEQCGDHEEHERCGTSPASPTPFFTRGKRSNSVRLYIGLSASGIAARQPLKG